MTEKTAPAAPRYADEEIARIAHEVIRALQDAYGQEVSPPWEEHDEEFRKAAADHISRLRAEGADARQAHEKWAAMRIAEGWTYGPVKDPVAKTSPWLVDFEEIPAYERAKDYVFQYLIAVLSSPPASRLPADVPLRLSRCPEHPGKVHAQLGSGGEWACLRGLADVAEAGVPGDAR